MTDSGADMAEVRVQWLGRIDFQQALAVQDRLAEQRLAGEVPDTILFLEHDPVYTIGRGRDKSSLLGVGQLAIPVLEINRGGQATYHGPGQLVGYPILALTDYGRDLHRYVRALEQALIDTCEEIGIVARRREGMTGVWVGRRKIASIGVGVRKWISMHGFAINVAHDLSGFDAITPCGISGVEMTSVEREISTAMSPEKLSGRLIPHLLERLKHLKSG